MVNFELLKSGLRYLSEILTICSSHVCANLMKNFLPLLNQPACSGPFLPKFWTALATVIVGIFFWKKFWLGSRPIPIAHWKKFWISWKKGVLQFSNKLQVHHRVVHVLINTPWIISLSLNCLGFSYSVKALTFRE